MGWAFEPVDAEIDDGSNDVPSGADPAAYALHYGTIPPGDVDWLDVGFVLPGAPIWVLCASARVGSGVADFTVSFFDDPNGAPLQAEQESKTQDLQWVDSPKWAASMPPPVASKGGQHYLKIESTAAIEGGPTNYHYLCFVYPQQP